MEARTFSSPSWKILLLLVSPACIVLVDLELIRAAEGPGDGVLVILLGILVVNLGLSLSLRLSCYGCFLDSYVFALLSA